MAEPKTMTAEESCRSLVARLEKYASDHPEAPLSQTLIDVVEMNVGLLATLDAERAAHEATARRHADDLDRATAPCNGLGCGACKVCVDMVGRQRDAAIARAEAAEVTIARALHVLTTGKKFTHSRAVAILQGSPTGKDADALEKARTK